MLKENFNLKRNVQLQNKSSIPKVYENIKFICTCYKTVENISEPHFSLFLKLIPINMIFPTVHEYFITNHTFADELNKTLTVTLLL